METSSNPTSSPAAERDRLDLRPPLLFFLFHLLLKLPLIGLNTGVYTDGILQITQFERVDSYWPPLYTALVWILRAAHLDPILAGRLVSIVASALLVFPIWTLARRWSGRRAALFALAVYTVSPLSMRWSLRVMTDMAFLLFFHLACVAWLTFAARSTEDMIRRRQLGMATLWAVLAVLTRYQGILLAPLVWGGVVVLWSRKARGRGWILAAQTLWLALPAWWLFQRFGHFEQIDERQGAAWAETLLNYWNVSEMFLYVLPYALTLPVFLFFLGGVFAGSQTPEGRLPVRWLLLYILLVVIAAQGVFQSFQTRYLLPIIPLAATCAGVGMARLEIYCAGKATGGKPLAKTLGSLAILLGLLWSMGFGLSSLFLQREAFGDIYAAGKFIRSLPDLPETAKLYTNESYKPHMNGIKLEFASRHPAELIPDLESLEQVAAGQSQEDLLRLWGSGEPDRIGVARMEPGSILALHTAYGGAARQGFLLQLLQKRYRIQPLKSGYFESSLVPLLPDIMQEPWSHQNPLAWGLRYQRQNFATRLYRVE